MILERTDKEILIRMPSSVDLTELQSMLDYLRYKELTANSKATQQDADQLAAEANMAIRSNIKKQRGL